MTAPITLLPCPFCGKPPVFLAISEDDSFVRCYQVRCDHCGIELSEEYKDQTIELWNTRAGAREATIEECARLIDENQETFSETAEGSRRHLTPRKNGNAMGLAFADGIRALAALQPQRGRP